MSLSVRPLTAAHAEIICSWRYPTPFDVYDLPPWPQAVSLNLGIVRPTVREKEFYALFSLDTLVGFFRLTLADGYIRFAVGLAPEHCGRGLGAEAIRLALDEAKRRYGSLPVRLEVRAFNRRAIRCYERAGFRETGRKQIPPLPAPPTLF